MFLDLLKMDCVFVKFFGLDLSIGLDCFWSRLFLVSISNLRSRNLPVSILFLISEKSSDLGIGLDVCGLNYITD